MERQLLGTPEKIPYLDYLQGRLLVTNNILLNPESGVRIYRYYNIDPKYEALYKAQLKNILDKMVAEKLGPKK